MPLYFALKDSSRQSYTTRQSYIENYPEPKAFPCGNPNSLILGIASSTSTDSNGSSSTTMTDSLHIARTIIFLVVTVLQAVQTIFLVDKRVSGTFIFFLKKDVTSIALLYYQSINLNFYSRTKQVLQRRQFVGRPHHNAARDEHSSTRHHMHHTSRQYVMEPKF